MTTTVGVDAVRTAVVEALAEAEGLGVVEVEAAIAGAGGDGALQLDSKQAEVIIAYVEDRFGCELPSPADLPKERFSTVAALIDLVAPSVIAPAEA